MPLLSIISDALHAERFARSEMRIDTEDLAKVEQVESTYRVYSEDSLVRRIIFPADVARAHPVRREETVESSFVATALTFFGTRRKSKSGLSKVRLQRLKRRYDRCATKAEL